MKRKLALLLLPASLLSTVALTIAFAQRNAEHPARYPSRGTRGAISAGSDYATDAGMRAYYAGGNAVDAGVSAMFAASVTEYSHFGFGGEAPILIRTADGKVHAIAGVGTMPKSATAQFFRDHKLQPGEITAPLEKGGLTGMVPVAGILAALVPGMVDAALVALREYGTRSFSDEVAPAIELADGAAIDEMRRTPSPEARRSLTCGLLRKNISCRTAACRALAKSSISPILPAHSAPWWPRSIRHWPRENQGQLPSMRFATTSIVARLRAR